MCQVDGLSGRRRLHDPMNTLPRRDFAPKTDARPSCGRKLSRVVGLRIGGGPAISSLPTGRTRGTRMQIAEARGRYVRWLLVTRDHSPHTIRAYDGDVAALERYLGSSARVELLGRESLMGFLEHLQLAGLSPVSIRRRASGLRGFCRWLVSMSLLDADPWVGTTVAVGRSRRLPRTLPAHELERLLRALRAAAGVREEPTPHALLSRPHESTTLLAVSVMVATGARVHEVVNLRCDDIDLSGQTLRIVGKGRRERHVFLTNRWITDLTGAYLSARQVLGVEHQRLFFNTRGQSLTTAALRSRLIKAADSAGLQTRVTPHVLRHTAATQLIEAGVDIRYIQRLLGHASLSTTEIYTHISDGALRRVVSEADVLRRALSR
jgi:integrase/recombinase XerC